MSDNDKGKRETSMVRMDPKLLRRVKVEAAKRGMFAKELVERAAEAYLSTPVGQRP